MYNFIQKFFSMRLKNKILLLLTSLLILILSTNIFIENKKLVENTKKEIYNELVYIAQQKVDYINAKYFNNIETICDVLKVSLLTHFDMKQLYNLEYITNVYIPNNQKFLRDILVTLPSVEGLAIYFNPDLYDIQLDEIPKLHIHRINDTLTTEVEKTSISTANSEWFTQPFVTKQAFWSKPFKLENTTIIKYTLPVFVKDKAFALIVMYQNYSPINSYIDCLMFDTNGYAYMLDNDSTVLSHPKIKELIGTKLDNIVNLENILKEDKNFDIIEYVFQDEEKIAVWYKLQNKDYLFLVSAEKDLLYDLDKTTTINRIISFIFVCITLSVIYLMFVSLKYK